MSNRTLVLTDPVYNYLLSVSLREHPVQQALRQETATLSTHGMQISPEQGQFMGLLVELMQARRTIEVGVYTGYSALSVALALPVDGEIVACDVNAEWTSIAQRYWQQAGVADKIKLHLAPALETLNNLLAAGQANTFDFAFIDADKASYDAYYEACLHLVRPGGLLVLDNTLRDGELADPAIQSKDVVALRQLNLKLHQDQRISLSLLPMSDGVTLARKR